MMTGVRVESGICGFSTTVQASLGKRKKVNIVIESNCQHVQKLAAELRELEMLDVLKAPINQNPIYMKAGQCNLHITCAVPCGVAKAAEAELDLALRKDVKINFLLD